MIERVDLYHMEDYREVSAGGRAFTYEINVASPSPGLNRPGKDITSEISLSKINGRYAVAGIRQYSYRYWDEQEERWIGRWSPPGLLDKSPEYLETGGFLPGLFRIWFELAVGWDTYAYANIVIYDHGWSRQPGVSEPEPTTIERTATEHRMTKSQQGPIGSMSAEVSKYVVYDRSSGEILHIHQVSNAPDVEPRTAGEVEPEVCDFVSDRTKKARADIAMLPVQEDELRPRTEYRVDLASRALTVK